MKNVAVYVRVSTADQRHDGQRAVIQQWLDGQSIKPEAVVWYADEESGTRMDRANMLRLQADVAGGRVKTVVVYKLDRISRSLADGIQLVADWTKKGVRVVSVTQQIDLSGTLGQTVAAVLFGFAQIETEYRAERQRAGIEAAKARGVYSGRKAGTTKGNPVRAKTLRAKGLTVEEVATAMGTSLRTVHRYLAA